MSDNLSPEDKLAAAFERAGMRDPEPVPEPDDIEDSGEEVSAEPESEEEVSASAEESAEPVEEAEEIEYEGKAYKLPKELKEALLRQQDYTKKTQEVASQRRFVEEQQRALELHRQFSESHADKVGQLRALEAQLQQFTQVNWEELATNNPTQYLQLDRQQRMLQDAANRIGGEVQQLSTQFQAQINEQRRKAQALCVEELKKEFPKEFGPEFIRNLDETGRSFGFSGEELAQIVDPRVIRVLHAAAQYQKLRTAKPIADKRVPAVESRPMAVKGARTANQSMQSAKLAEVKATLKKTGKASDAEAFLAARFAKAMR